jgi:hypothetical protein
MSFREQSSLKRLRQAVTLTGFDTNKFKVALDSIGAIYGMFSKEVNTGTQVLTRWIPTLYRDWPSVTISNNYFSTGRAALELPVVDFDPLVDPNGILASVDTSRFHHTSDNAVGYYEKKTKGENGFKSVIVISIVLLLDTY